MVPIRGKKTSNIRACIFRAASKMGSRVFFYVRGFPLYFYVNDIPNINSFGTTKRPNTKKLGGPREGGLIWRTPQNYFCLWLFFSGHVRLRQGTEICNFGVLSPLDSFEFSPVDYFHFSSGFLCNLVRKSPQNVEKIGRCRGREKSVEACHVSGCHDCFDPDFRFLAWSVFRSGNPVQRMPRYNRTCRLS